MKTLAYRGREAADPRFHDGALRPVMGACHIQVMRANREHPELSQGTDFTYNHAPMLCRWHGRMYLMYLSSPVHEHDGLANALLTDSPDGLQCGTPDELSANGSLGRYFSREGLTFDPEHLRFRYEAQVVLPQQ